MYLISTVINSCLLLGYAIKNFLALIKQIDMDAMDDKNESSLGWRVPVYIMRGLVILMLLVAINIPPWDWTSRLRAFTPGVSDDIRYSVFIPWTGLNGDCGEEEWK